eukprot:12546028-Prorocentrum_lima.AAC.1
MTSSLVGSEMCIRDSPRDSPNICYICGSKQHFAKDCTRPKFDPTIPSVSYTHLTLPTICSV